MSRKKRRRRRLLLIIPLLVLTGLILLVELHLSPYIRELARNQAVNAASNAIIEAVSLTMSNADFFSDFTAAGINQTLQTLKVKFTISLTILTTVGYETVDVDSDVMLAQTVIVGTVPETYVNLGHLTTTEGWEQYGTETGN